MRFVLAGLFAIFFFTTSANAQVITGDDLLKACTDEDTGSLSYCLGFIRGVNETYGVAAFMALTSQGLQFDDPEQIETGINSVFDICPGPSVTFEQLIELIVKYLTDHPETRHEIAVGLIMDSYKEAFPCPS